MPEGYERLRDKLREEKKLGYRAAQKKAAKIWNSRHPDNPVSRKKHKKRR